MFGKYVFGLMLTYKPAFQGIQSTIPRWIFVSGTNIHGASSGMRPPIPSPLPLSFGRIRKRSSAVPVAR